jgi:hypothetical protein
MIYVVERRVGTDRGTGLIYWDGDAQAVYVGRDPEEAVLVYYRSERSDVRSDSRVTKTQLIVSGIGELDMPPIELWNDDDPETELEVLIQKAKSSLE